MKQIITYIFVLLAVCSCSWFDDSKIWEELREHEERIERLEALCGRLNSNVEALQGIMKALEANDYVTDITRIMEDGMEVGYSITFAKGGTITVYHGVDGADASAPKIGIRKASDGEYYWTADDEWMTDEDGEMIPASVAEDTESGYITPQFRVAGGKWYVSVDNGNSWREIEDVNDQEKVIFSDIQINEDHIIFTLEDGNTFTVPIYTAVQSGVEDIYATSYCVVPGVVDMSKMESLLAAAKGKTIRFNDGEYIFPSHIKVPSDISFIGNTTTVFKLADDSKSNVLFHIVSANNVTISRIFIDGGEDKVQPMGSKENIFDRTDAGNRYGIWCEKSRRIKIHDVEVYGWDLCGLYCRNNEAASDPNGRFYHAIELTNSSFYCNYYGLWYGQYGEYNRTESCNFGDNFIGVLNEGGNNMYVGCYFNSNYCGFALNGDGIINESHGGCYSCTYNHNSESGQGGGIAIYANKSTIGWSFTGENIWYGAIKLIDCKGIIFDGGIWGNVQFTSISSEGLNNQNIVTDTYFYTNPDTIFANNDGSTYIYDCLPGTTTEEKVNFLNFIQSCEIVENMVHFSCDDTYACLYDLILNGDTYESIFENSFFASLKKCHDETGACFTLMTFNTHTQVPDYDISKVPSKFQSEFQECQSWLRFAFHAENETTRYATATGILESYNRFVSSIYTLTGDYECIDRIARLGFFSGSLDNVLQIKNAGHGIIGLLTADDTRTSYYLSHEESETARLKGKYYDLDNGLIFIKTLNRNWANAKEEMTTNPLYRKMTEFFWHEYEDVSSVRPWVTTAAQLCNDMGYIHGFPADLYKPIE